MATGFQAFRYVLIKLTASGISWLLFQLIMLIFLNGNLSATFHLMQNSFLAFLFFVYGTTCSIVIDGILLFFRREEHKRAARWLLFTLSGFLFFGFTMGWNAGMAAVGPIGTFFALVQSAASFGLARSRKAVYPFSAVVAFAWLASLAYG
ncbi:hypothetical protein [Cohnella zeiphila]|uniref:Uncharacterized protein n=1 Tax=Cohnella zeiphila TaxID=2761120 RepID=A0A7X0SJC5_9BACL|nr:hypothetical protein [Cohnella zeiphila]MBB6731044.1 hypothetical protein [Cohnella zeiphila]